PLVDLVVLLGCLLLRFGVATVLVQRRRRGLEVLLPLRVLLLELLLADALRRRNEGDAVPDEDVEFAVPVHVIHPDPGRPRAAGGGGPAGGPAVRRRGGPFCSHF